MTQVLEVVPRLVGLDLLVEYSADHLNRAALDRIGVVEVLSSSERKTTRRATPATATLRSDHLTRSTDEAPHGLAAFALTAVLPMASALAAPPDAADFAADCNADGRVDVAGTDRYVGGTGALSGDCIIVLDTGATLVLREVKLTGAGNLVAISSPEETTIRVVDSVIDVAGYLELTAGCCAGDAGVPEQDGTVVVKRSTLRAAGVLLWASFDWPNGRVLVRSSDLEARSSGITVGASDVAGSDGTARVVEST